MKMKIGLLAVAVVMLSASGAWACGSSQGSVLLNQSLMSIDKNSSRSGECMGVSVDKRTCPMKKKAGMCPMKESSADEKSWGGCCSAGK